MPLDIGRDQFRELKGHVVIVARTQRHADVQAQLIFVLITLAAPHGLAVRGPVNIGLSEHDHRVPDAVVVRERAKVVWVPTAAIVVEVVSPGDETYDKFDFYHARGVAEILVADPAKEELTLFRRGAAHYEPADSSAVLEASVAAIAGGISWP